MKILSSNFATFVCVALGMIGEMYLLIFSLYFVDVGPITNFRCFECASDY